MRKWMVALMAVLCIGLAALVVGLRTTSDHEGPEIIFDKDKESFYQEDMDNEELLEGVTAKDDKDGDVSDTLTVESVYPKENGKEVVVIFVAKDSSNNVTKEEFTMSTEKKDKDSKKSSDKKAKENNKQEETPVTTPDTNAQTENGEQTGLGDPAAEQTGAGVTGEIPGVPEPTGTEPNPLEAGQPQDLAAKEEGAKRAQEEKITKLNPQDPRMYLTTYYLEVPVGTNIDRLSYIADIQDDVDATNELWRKIQIDGSLDVNTPGTYELTYFVVDSNGNSSNGAVLTIVVE
ncbi:DUF5011 domain-containing protein [Blautia schinkii]|nr:DUF5011 domain-containing protein [Blautia schinkii]